MTSSRSAAQITSSTTVVPTCDAWINMQYDTDKAPTVNDGYGILGTHRVSAGLYGISFSNPEQFGGGAYIAICTPEFGVDAGYGPQILDSTGLGLSTSTGKSAGIRVINFNYPAFHPGGGTATIGDSATVNAVRSNVAVFALATETDRRSPEVGNWIKDSTLTTSLPPSGVSGPIGIPNSYQVNQSINPAINNIQAVAIQSAATPAWFKSTPWTSSIFIKGEIGGEQIFIRSVSGSKELLTLTNTWKRYSITGTQTTGTSVEGIQVGLQSSLASGLGGTATSASATYYIAGAQLEPGSLMTEFVSTPAGTQLTSYTGTKGNQDARKRLVPGAGGFGTVGATYSSSLFNKVDKRKAVAYGTIVIPPNKGNSSTVSAYIENGFNVKGVSAGANSLFDVSFVTPMTSNTYCTILTGEYESNTETNLTAATPEFSLLLIRAGLNNKYKTTSGFRVESLKQNPADNSWTQQSVIYQSGLTERIHFMVFGEALQGQSFFLANPFSIPAATNNLDYEVWGAAWGLSDLTNTNSAFTTAKALGYIPGKPSIVPIGHEYSAGGFHGVLQQDLGITMLNGGNASGIADIIKNVPQSRRVVELRGTSGILPVNKFEERERLYQYYAIRDGYTYESVEYPGGITNAGWTSASFRGNYNEGLVMPNDTTVRGATFSASRRVLNIFSDTQAKDMREAVTDLHRKLGALGATVGVWADDCENSPGYFGNYTMSSLYQANPMVSGGYAMGHVIMTNAAINSNSFTNPNNPDSALSAGSIAAGICADLLYDYYGLSAAGSSNRLKLVNASDPEQLRWMTRDPRILTYQYSPGGGPTTAASPTVNSRFMEIYGDMCKRWNVTGQTATSIVDAANILYAHVGPYPKNLYSYGAGNFPSDTLAWDNTMPTFQGFTTENYNAFLLRHAFDKTVNELMWGHYRWIGYSDCINEGAEYSMYNSGGIGANDMEISTSGYAFPQNSPSLTHPKTLNAPVFYADSIDSEGTSPYSRAGFYENPVTRSQKYCLNGRVNYGNWSLYTNNPGDDLYGNDIIRPAQNCKRFYPKTGVGYRNSNPTNNSAWTVSDGYPHPGSGYGQTGTIWTAPAGATVESVSSAGFTVWGGITAVSGDYIWVQDSTGITRSTPLTIKNNAGSTASGKKLFLKVFEPFESWGLSVGTTFTVEHAIENTSFRNFIWDLQRFRAMLRSTPEMISYGSSPYLCPPHRSAAPACQWGVDHRYFYEFTYHLLLSGVKYIQYFNAVALNFDGVTDNNSITLHKILEGWRNISGNSRVRPVTLDLIQLNSTVIVSGGQVLQGKLTGKYLWRITVRPGTLGFDETVVVSQNTRSDIPLDLVIPGGSVPEHNCGPAYQHGTRGVWLITKSATPPVYTISSVSSPASGIIITTR